MKKKIAIVKVKQLGKCEVYLNEQKIGEVELYCDRDVEKGGFFDNLKYNMKNLFKKGV